MPKVRKKRPSWSRVDEELPWDEIKVETDGGENSQEGQSEVICDRRCAHFRRVKDSLSGHNEGFCTFNESNERVLAMSSLCKGEKRIRQ